MYLRVTATDWEDPGLAAVRAVLRRHPGRTPVRIKLEPAGRWIEVPADHRVRATPDLAAALQQVLGAGAVVVRNRDT